MALQGTQNATGNAEDSGSGAASIAGYEYQIDVSVWLALDLILVSRQAQEIFLEPASQEDLEAEIGDCEPGRLISQVPMPGYKLIVQAKRREGNAWTPKTLKSLLEYGSDHRVSASKRLEDPQYRYVLVTSAGVSADARKLYRRRPGMWPGQGSMPNLIARGIGHDISGRFSVIANQDDERLRGDIDHLLRESCRIPNACLQACRTQLREAARARIANAGGGRWSRLELEEIIRHHDGYLASSPELEHYVHPNNWSELRSRMKSNSAAILIGQSGTGKTLATRMLYDELRKEVPGLTRVLIRQGPSQIGDDTTPTPVLYDIEDPWGRFDFDRNSRPWNDQIASILASARPDRMIIATSRLDVVMASGVLEDIKRWAVRLEAEDYGADKRHKLYATRIDTLPHAMRALARHSESQVLGELATPLEIQKFFDALRILDPSDFPYDFVMVSQAIRQAHRDSIQRTVIEQIEARGDIDSAAILWALLGAGNRLTRSILGMIEDGLCDMNVKFEGNASSLVDFFVAARNFRQDEAGGLTYYHPSVEAGFTRVLERHRPRVRQVLSRLIDLLTSLQGPQTNWGIGEAARIVEQVRDTYALTPSEMAQQRIDTWFHMILLEEGKAFADHLKLAAKVGSRASNSAEIARYLMHRSTFAPARNIWQAPEADEEWYRARSTCGSTKPLLERYIRELLPLDRANHPKAFAQGVARLSPDLAPVFLDVARSVVEQGHMFSDGAIAYGALQDVKAFESVLDSVVSFLTPTNEELQKRLNEQLDVINCVYEDDYEYFLAENDRGHTACEFLKSYVEVARRDGNWGDLADHRHIEWLRPYWLRGLVEDVRKGSLNDDDFAAAFSIGYGSEYEENLWLALSLDWKEKYRPVLESRLREGASAFSIEYSALACALRSDPSTWLAVLADLERQGKVERLIEIGRALAFLCNHPTEDGESHALLAKSAVTQLPSALVKICLAEIDLKSERPASCAEPALILLQNINDASDMVRALRLKLDAVQPLQIEDDVRWALVCDDNHETVMDAVSAAIRHGMTMEVEKAIDSRFAHAVAMALTSIASSTDKPLPARFLELANHRGSPVRLALVQALTDNVHSSYRQTLIKLAKDQWSKEDLYPSGDYPIARSAIAGLIELGGLDESQGLELLSAGMTSPDRKVLESICQLLACSSPSMQRKIFDLAISDEEESSQSAAIHAMLNARDSVDQSLIDAITVLQLVTSSVRVAAFLALLLGARGDVPSLLEQAKELAGHPQRRVLLFLVAGILNKRNPVAAKEVVEMVTTDREVKEWALDCRSKTIDGGRIAGFGSPSACAEVLRFMAH